MFSRIYIATIFAFAIATNLALTPAQAQKPALTQNVDEKGRVPFHQTLFLGSGSTPVCDGCSITFQTVPAGYRLVVTFISVQYNCAKPAINSAYAYFGTPDNGTPNVISLPTPVQDAFNYCTTSTPVTFYVEGGVAPSLLIHNVANSSTGVASIQGYRVNLNQP